MNVGNSNHPKLGSSIKVEPIRRPASIRSIKQALKDNPRDFCLFTFGINTAYRANEILSISVGQVRHLKVGDRLDIKQSKSGKYRAITMNRTVIQALKAWLEVHPDPSANAPLFISQRSRKALTVSALSRMVKNWCKDAGLEGNYGSHSMRKTWGYHQRVHNKQVTPLLMIAFGHTSERQTLDYLCIQDDEVEALFELEL